MYENPGGPRPPAADAHAKTQTVENRCFTEMLVLFTFAKV